MKFSKFIVEEQLSAENQCNYDVVKLSYGNHLLEFCDHTWANKNQQVKRFNQNVDPKKTGWFEWNYIGLGQIIILRSTTYL